MNSIGTKVAHPEDFALVFHEQEPYSEDRVRFDNEHGGLSFTYSEPNALWQGCKEWDPAGKLQPEAFLARVRERAAQPPTVTTDYPLGTQPRKLPDALLAQVWLNSYVGKEGQITSAWSEPPGRLATNMNSDPALPRPNRASLWFDYEGVPALTDPRVGGAYLDSLGWGAFDAAEDFRPDHWTTATIPLIPSFQEGSPAQLGEFTHYPLYQAISEAMHQRGKLVLANTFAFNHLFTAHLLDVLGAGEAGDLEACHDVKRLSFCRALSYRKPLSHMNYAYFSKDVPRADKERALQRTLLYCAWPGSGNVAEPAQIEPLRPLYKRYMPLFSALARAGWEPITEALAQPEPVVVERYGSPQAGVVYLVAHNPSTEASRATVRLVEGLAAGRWLPQVRDRITGATVTLTAGALTVDLKPWQTVMLELRRERLSCAVGR